MYIVYYVRVARPFFFFSHFAPLDRMDGWVDVCCSPVTRPRPGRIRQMVTTSMRASVSTSNRQISRVSGGGPVRAEVAARKQMLTLLSASKVLQHAPSVFLSFYLLVAVFFFLLLIFEDAIFPSSPSGCCTKAAQQPPRANCSQAPARAWKGKCKIIIRTW